MPYERAGKAQTPYPTFPTWDPTRLNGHDFLTDLSHWWTQTNQAVNERGALFGLNTTNRVNAGIQPGVDLLRTLAFAPQGHEAIFRLLDRMGLGYLRPQYNQGQPGMQPTPQPQPQIQFGTQTASHGPNFGLPSPNYQGSVTYRGGVPSTQFLPGNPNAEPTGAEAAHYGADFLPVGTPPFARQQPAPSGFLPVPEAPRVPGQRGGGTGRLPGGSLPRPIPTSRPMARRR